MNLSANLFVIYFKHEISFIDRFKKFLFLKVIIFILILIIIMIFAKNLLKINLIIKMIIPNVLFLFLLKIYFSNIKISF